MNGIHFSSGIRLIAALLLSSAAQASDLRVDKAAKELDKTQVRELLTQKAGVNDASPDGMTALHWAVYNNDVEMVRMLLDAGASVKAVTRMEALTPLLMTANR